MVLSVETPQWNKFQVAMNEKKIKCLTQTNRRCLDKTRNNKNTVIVMCPSLHTALHHCQRHTKEVWKEGLPYQKSTTTKYPTICTQRKCTKPKYHVCFLRNMTVNSKSSATIANVITWIPAPLNTNMSRTSTAQLFVFSPACLWGSMACTECLTLKHTQSLAMRKWMCVSALGGGMSVRVSIYACVRVLSCPDVWMAFLQLTLFLFPVTSSEPSFHLARLSFRKPTLCESKIVCGPFFSVTVWAVVLKRSSVFVKPLMWYVWSVV